MDARRKARRAAAAAAAAASGSRNNSVREASLPAAAPGNSSGSGRGSKATSFKSPAAPASANTKSDPLINQSPGDILNQELSIGDPEQARSSHLRATPTIHTPATTATAAGKPPKSTQTHTPPLTARDAKADEIGAVVLPGARVALLDRQSTSSFAGAPSRAPSAAAGTPHLTKTRSLSRRLAAEVEAQARAPNLSRESVRAQELREHEIKERRKRREAQEEEEMRVGVSV